MSSYHSLTPISTLHSCLHTFREGSFLYRRPRVVLHDLNLMQCAWRCVCVIKILIFKRLSPFLCLALSFFLFLQYLSFVYPCFAAFLSLQCVLRAQDTGASDYLRLCELYHTIVLCNVPRMSLATKDAARRFIVFIDTLYDRKVPHDA